MSNYSSSNTNKMAARDPNYPSTLTNVGNTTTGPYVPTASTMSGTGIDTNKYDSTMGTMHDTNTMSGPYSSGLGSGSIIGSNTGTGHGSTAGYGSGSGLSSGGLGHSNLGSTTTTTSGAPYSTSQSGLHTTGVSGSSSTLGSSNYNDGIAHYPTNTTTSHPGAIVAGGAVAEHERHTHAHHHDHTGHHSRSGLQKAGIGHDPALMSNNPPVVGTGFQGTGLASGFAIDQRSVAPVNPATGAPDYMVSQTANLNDNIRGGAFVGPAIVGAGAGALGVTTAATASKVATASGLPKRVLMVLTSSTLTMPDGKNSGYHWSEVFHPYEIFKKHGYDVDLTSLTGRASPDYHSVNWLDQLTGMELSSMNAWRSKSHPLHKDLENIRTPNQLQSSQYGIIYFTGGHATLEDFPNAEAYQRFAADIYERNGIVCAVCHGVCCLGNVRLHNGSYLLNGKQVTGFSEEGEKQMKVLDWMHERKFPLIADHVSKAGGIYQAPNKPFDEFVVDSDRVITGPNPASAGPVAERAVRILEGR